MKLDIIIGHANTDQTRDRNLKYIIQTYHDHFPKAKIYVVEQNTTTDLTEFQFPITWIGLPTNHSYSRSLGFNEGVRASSGDTLLLTDNDCIPNVKCINEIKSGRALSDCQFLIPYKWVIDLNESETNDLIKTGKTAGKNIRTHNGETIVNHGGVTVITREGFETIGGFDPQFIGWGGEDFAFYSKAKKLLKIKRSEHNMYHLNHQREFKRAMNPEATRNRKEAHRISDLTTDALKTYINKLGTDHFA